MAGVRTLLVDSPLRPGPATITGDEAHHGRKVLRLRPGDRLRCCDGDGRAAEAEVRLVRRDRLEVDCGAVVTEPPLPGECLTVVVAPPRGGVFASLVRSLTELGVGAIHPLRCARAVRMPRRERLERAAREALKQCRRCRAPRIGEVLDITACRYLPGRLILCDGRGGAPMPGPVEDTVIVVGPEGGLDGPEREELLGAGAASMRLARPVLRVETAAVAAVATWTAAWERR